MPFEMQACNPVISDHSNVERETLASAIIAVFPESSEDAFMVWNWVPIRVNFHSDLSVIIEDVLLMLRAVLGSDEGAHVASFGSSTFRAKWSVRWTATSLTIDADWDAIAGSYEELLNSRRTLDAQRMEFLRQWKPLLNTVLGAIETSGIRIEDREQVALLRQVEAALPD